MALYPYHLGGCTITVDEEARWLQTTLPDGSVVDATGNDDAESLEMAARLGYADTWTMSRDHELMHTWLAVQAGLSHSPTLWRVAHPGDASNISDDEVAREEQAVLDAQAALDKAAPRPWDLDGGR